MLFVFVLVEEDTGVAASGPTMTGPVTVSFTRITTTETHTADKPKPEPAIFSTEELSTFTFLYRAHS